MWNMIKFTSKKKNTLYAGWRIGWNGKGNSGKTNIKLLAFQHRDDGNWTG